MKNCNFFPIAYNALKRMQKKSIPKIFFLARLLLESKHITVDDTKFQQGQENLFYHRVLLLRNEFLFLINLVGIWLLIHNLFCYAIIF